MVGTHSVAKSNDSVSEDRSSGEYQSVAIAIWTVAKACTVMLCGVSFNIEKFGVGFLHEERG